MKPIPNYPNYSVTEDGKVYSVKKNKWLKNSLMAKGYYVTTLRDTSNTKKTVFIHRILGVTYLENPNNYPMINHKNGIKSDNRLENLEWCTASQNIKHAWDTGLNSRIYKKGLGRLKSIKPLIDLQTGVFYNSVKEASILLGINKNTLYGYLIGTNPNKTSLIYA